MLEEEYQPRRRLPPHLRSSPPSERGFYYVIRVAERRDIPSVREIYNHYVANSIVTFDTQAATLGSWHRRFVDSEQRGLPFLVAESGSGQILGFALVKPTHTRRSARFSVENSIYLGAAATGKGLGRALLGELIVRSAAAGLREMIAIIADHGADASLALHHKLGFVEVGRMARVTYKFDRWLGTIMLRRRLTRPRKAANPAVAAA